MVQFLLTPSAAAPTYYSPCFTVSAGLAALCGDRSGG